IGEPTLHSHLPDWIAQARAIGARVEMITNGTLLDEEKSRQLIKADLDRLWVSIDGATPDSYADVRLGAELPHVIENMMTFRRLRSGWRYLPRPEIGVAFVAMKRNIQELPEVLKIARRIGAMYFKVSNVLPISDDLRSETLYDSVLNDITYLTSSYMPHLSLPKMAFTDETREALFKAFRSGYNVNFAGNKLSGANNVCNFIESGSMSIAWSGNASPCLPLLHTHVHHLKGHLRLSQAHVIGNVAERGLLELWNDPEYVAYREHVQGFAFAPCTSCGGCEMLDGNAEDCLANTFPACGGCLWAQGFVQCP
ncbi:MAG TPA: SPASM domain-containing protein, partial [Anaerolineae bacterium]